MFQQQPASASLANVLVYKTYTIKATLQKFISIQQYKYMAILSDSISGLGQ